MRVGKETYYMAAIYLAPFYLLVCVYILLRSLHWFQVLHMPRSVSKAHLELEMVDYLLEQQ